MSRLDAGIAVVVLQQDEDSLERGRRWIAEYYAHRIAAGRAAPAETAAWQATLRPTTRWELLDRATMNWA